MQYKDFDLMMTYVKAFSVADRNIYIPDEIWITKVIPYLGQIDRQTITLLKRSSATTYALYLSAINSTYQEEASAIFSAYNYWIKYKYLKNFYKNSVPIYLLQNATSPMSNYINVLSASSYKEQLNKFLQTVTLEYLKNYRDDVAIPFIGGSIELTAIARIWNCNVELIIHPESSYCQTNHIFYPVNTSSMVSVKLNVKCSYDKKILIGYVPENSTNEQNLMDVFAAFSEAYSRLSNSISLPKSYIKKRVEQFLLGEYLLANNENDKYCWGNKKGEYSSGIIHNIFKTYIYETTLVKENLLFDLITECEIKSKARYLHHRFHNISNSFLDNICQQISVNNIKPYILRVAREELLGGSKPRKCISVTMWLYVMHPYIFILNIGIGVGFIYIVQAMLSLEPMIQMSINIAIALPLYLSHSLFLGSIQPYCEAKTKYFDSLSFSLNLPGHVQHQTQKCRYIFAKCHAKILELSITITFGALIVLPIVAWLLPLSVNIVTLVIQYACVIYAYSEVIVTSKEKEIARFLKSSLVEYSCNKKRITATWEGVYTLYGVESNLIDALKKVPDMRFVAGNINNEMIGCKNYLQSLLDEPSFRRCMTDKTLDMLYENIKILSSITTENLKHTTPDVIQLNENTDKLILILSDRERRINDYHSVPVPRYDSLSECLRHISSNIMFTRNINEPLVNDAANESLGQRRNLVMNMV